MVSPVGDDFFVGATFGRPHGLYKFKPCRSQKRAVEGASPYSFFGQNRSARCWGTTMVSYAHSSFLIPHSSLNRKLPIFNDLISDLSHLVPVMRVMVIQASNSKEPSCFRSLYALNDILINHAILRFKP
jgi:hypothetical protein